MLMCMCVYVCIFVCIFVFLEHCMKAEVDAK